MRPASRRPGKGNRRPDPTRCRSGRHLLAEVGTGPRGTCAGCQDESRARSRAGLARPQSHAVAPLTGFPAHVSRYADRVLAVQAAYHAVRMAQFAGTRKQLARALRYLEDALAPLLRWSDRDWENREGPPGV